MILERWSNAKYAFSSEIEFFSRQAFNETTGTV